MSYLALFGWGAAVLALIGVLGVIQTIRADRKWRECLRDDPGR